MDLDAFVAMSIIAALATCEGLRANLMGPATGPRMHRRRSRRHHIVSAQIGDVAAWLTLHGVKASQEILPRNETETARRLLDRALALNAGLIVSGAYGHLRLTEWLLGGVTRSLHADSDLCLLMAR